MLGIPTTGHIEPYFMAGLFKSMFYFHRFQSRSTIQLKIVEREIIHNARQQILINAYRSRVDFLLFIDDDMLLRQKTIIKLFNNPYATIGAFYCGRQKPYTPILYNLNKENKYVMVKPDMANRYQIVDGTGLACNLISREAIEATAYKSLWNGKYSHGEDVRFWEIVKENNIPCVVDSYNEIGHCTKSIEVINYEAHKKFMES